MFTETFNSSQTSVVFGLAGVYGTFSGCCLTRDRPSGSNLQQSRVMRALYDVNGGCGD